MAATATVPATATATGPATATGTATVTVPATATATATATASPTVTTERPLDRAFVWGGTVFEVALVSSMVLEVGFMPPVDDNGPRLLAFMGASLALAVGTGWLAAELGWPEQGALALNGAVWGAFALAPFGVLVDGGRSRTTDGLDTGPFTAAFALSGAVVGGVLAPLLLDVHEPTETIALYVAPGLGAFIGTLVWLGLWIFGVVPDEPVASSRALVAAAGIGGTLGLALPFGIRAVRATNE